VSACALVDRVADWAAAEVMAGRSTPEWGAHVLRGAGRYTVIVSVSGESVVREEDAALYAALNRARAQFDEWAELVDRLDVSVRRVRAVRGREAANDAAVPR
jgi:hypothetical protein